MNKIRKPTMPNREEPVVIRTTRASTVIMTITGTTPITPFFTTFLPELVLAKRPRVSEPNSAGIR